MAVDRPEVQRGVNKWTLLLGCLVGGIAFLLGYRFFFYGVVFGIVLMILNYRVVGIILDKTFKTIAPSLAKILSFISYHVRFWILVILMYLVIPRAGFEFGIGTFVGFIIPKVVMGVMIIIHTDEEWWRYSKPTETKPGSKPRDEGIRFPGLDFDEGYLHKEVSELTKDLVTTKEVIQKNNK